MRACIITFQARVHAYKVCCNVTRVDTPHELNNVAENIWLASRQKEGKTGRQARHADRQAANRKAIRNKEMRFPSRETPR